MLAFEIVAGHPDDLPDAAGLRDGIADALHRDWWAPPTSDGWKLLRVLVHDGPQPSLTGRAFPAPPVSTAGWSADDWQRWADHHGDGGERLTVTAAGLEAIDANPEPWRTVTVHVKRGAVVDVEGLPARHRWFVEDHD